MSTFGFMSTCIPLRERSPSTRKTVISTITNTGRWIESRVKPIALLQVDHPKRLSTKARKSESTKGEASRELTTETQRTQRRGQEEPTRSGWQSGGSTRSLLCVLSAPSVSLWLIPFVSRFRDKKGFLALRI